MKSINAVTFMLYMSKKLTNCKFHGYKNARFFFLFESELAMLTLISEKEEKKKVHIGGQEKV